MAIIAASTGKALQAAGEAKLFGLSDESGAAGGAQTQGTERRAMKLKGFNITVIKASTAPSFLLDGKAGKVLAALPVAVGSTTVMFNNAGQATGNSDAVEISTGELYVEVGTAGEASVVAYIEE